MLGGLIPLGEGREDLLEADSEQCIRGEMGLMAQQMQFHQQLIGSASVQRWNHVRKSGMKSSFAVRDRPKPCQGSLQLNQGMTIALPMPPLGSIQCAGAA